MKKIIIRVVLLLVVVCGIFVVCSVLSVLIPRHGTVASVSDLQRVFNKAGPEIAVTFTNTLIQKFPFVGKVNWELGFFKMSYVTLSGKVDTNAFHQFVSEHPSTLFVWSGIDKNGKNWGSAENWPSGKGETAITWHSVSFKADPVGGGNAAVIQGEVQFPSCMGTVMSWSPDWIPVDKK
ncbi:MAG TPA: hypothetical protein VJT54_08810 [Verrucomicrobiae bacterium]|nr:hypothetical protein [Verrucomicrobiae bacterium]